MKNNKALAYLSGVFNKPSRFGSSPKHSKIVVTAPVNCFNLISFSSSVSFLRFKVPAAIVVNI